MILSCIPPAWWVEARTPLRPPPAPCALLPAHLVSALACGGIAMCLVTVAVGTKLSSDSFLWAIGIDRKCP